MSKSYGILNVSVCTLIDEGSRYIFKCINRHCIFKWTLHFLGDIAFSSFCQDYIALVSNQRFGGGWMEVATGEMCTFAFFPRNNWGSVLNKLLSKTREIFPHSFFKTLLSFQMLHLTHPPETLMFLIFPS